MNGCILISMGKFDASIEWLSHQIANSMEVVRDLRAGEKIVINDKDVTDELISTHEGLIDRFKKLIAAYRIRND